MSNHSIWFYAEMWVGNIHPFLKFLASEYHDFPWPENIWKKKKIFFYRVLSELQSCRWSSELCSQRSSTGSTWKPGSDRMGATLLKGGLWLCRRAISQWLGYLSVFFVISMNALSTQADGSAIVRQGATTVVCGVRAELAPPRPEEPDRGYLVRQTLNIEY